MPVKNPEELKLRNLLEQNSNGGLKIKEIKEVISLIESPQESEEYCFMCKKEKEDGWGNEVKTSIYNSGICQNHIRYAFVTKQNPFDESFKQRL